MEKVSHCGLQHVIFSQCSACVREVGRQPGWRRFQRRRIAHNWLWERIRMGDGINHQCLKRTQQQIGIGGWIDSLDFQMRRTVIQGGRNQPERCFPVFNAPDLIRR